MPPNIVMIMSDDTDHSFLGFGGGRVLTPHIDAIAANGVVLDRFHCVATVCMPSRYTMLTGRYPSRCRDDFFLKQNPPGEPASIGFNTHINPQFDRTIGNVLHDAGYRTGYVGKWHTGPQECELGTKWFDVDDDPADPAIHAKLGEHQRRLCEQIQGCGFDFAGGVSWGNPQAGDRQIRKLEVHNLEWMAHHAARFIDESAAAGEPFFLHFAPTPIHGNGHIESLMSDIRLTPEGCRDEHIGVMPDRATIYERIVDAGLPFDYITAGALWLDDAVGAVMHALRRHGLEDDTIVIYCSDHGACEDKATVYQGGTHIPCVLQWPGRIAGGRRVTALAQHVDWLPTFAALAGASIEAGDGVDLSPLLLGERIGRATADSEGCDALYFEHAYSRAVRTDRWKYIAYRLPEQVLTKLREGRCERAPSHSGSDAGSALCLSLERHPHYFEPDQLYDLAADPGERHNLAFDPAYSQIVADMRQRLARYLATFDHPFPLDRVDTFHTEPGYDRLIERQYSRNTLDKQIWWRRRWHHRPEEVRPPSLTEASA